ncbi:MAG: EAL domain-containing protein, partial [Pseudomonadota bacterium]|nr:EAL domain-containing protein [Pseudomonadota bacterium]
PTPDTAAEPAPRLYILTDDPDQGQSLAARLGAHGFAVETFTDLEALRAALLARAPHALVADLAFSVEDTAALEAVAVLRQATDRPLPVIWLSARTDTQTRLLALRAGGSACLGRPPSLPQLVAKLRELTGADGQRPYRVLMVDDDRAILDLYAGRLRAAGFEVSTITDPLEILEVALAFQPELILLDLYMPGADGFEVSRLIRQEEALLNTPVVFLSGEKDVHKHLKAIGLGALDFLVKPVRPAELVEVARARAAQYRRLAARTRYLGRTDPVTGLYARDYFFALLAERLHRPDAGLGLAALLFVELDNYAAASRSAPAELVRLARATLARRLRDRLAAADVAACYSESAFAILTRQPDFAALERLAEALRQGVAETVTRHQGQTLGFTASIGIARAGGGDPRRIVSEAALTASLAQQAGGDRVRFQDTLAGDGEAQAQRRYWAGQINSAVKDGRLLLAYQPIASLGADRVERYEVLLRMKDSANQTVLPGQFMPMAEQLNLTRLLDRWVVRRALQVLAGHQKTTPESVFFTKLSAATVLDPGFCAWLSDGLGRQPVQSGSLVLELAESALLASPAAAKSLMEGLHALHVGIAVEHFGAGGQSLDSLQGFPIDYVKLDQSLIHDLPARPEHQEAVRRIIHQAHARNVRTLAAYVEDASALSLLWQYRIDLVQGYFLQQPGELLHFGVEL